MHIHNTVLFNWLKALGNWRFFALRRDKVTIPLYTLPEKKSDIFKGGGKNFCNFVALCVKVNTTLICSRYKKRYKKLFLSRCVYVWKFYLVL